MNGMYRRQSDYTRLYLLCSAFCHSRIKPISCNKSGCCRLKKVLQKIEYDSVLSAMYIVTHTRLWKEKIDVIFNAMGQGFCTQSLFFLENLEPLRRRLIFTLTYNDFCFLFIGQESEDDLGTGKQVRSKVSRYLNY